MFLLGSYTRAVQEIHIIQKERNLLSDAIKNCADEYPESDIIRITNDYLDIINKDTLCLDNWVYCY